MNEPALFELPDRLLRAPLRFPDPPATSGRTAELPLDRLPWENFELFALDYLRRVKGWKEPRLYGNRGHAQRGIDLVDTAGEEHPSCQVKRNKTFGPADLRGAVELWIESPPLDSKEFCVKLSRKASPDLIDELHGLRQAYPGVRLAIVDAARLNDELRQHPDLIRIHFHEAWVDAYCDPQATKSMSRSDDYRAYVRNAVRESDHRLRTRVLAAGVPQNLMAAVLESSKSINKARISQLPSDPILIVEGPFGAGKSALLESLLRFQADLCLEDETQPFPIFIRARGAPLDIENALPDKATAQIRPILLIDGLDEVAVSRSRELVAQAMSLLHAGRIARVVMSRRPGDQLFDIPVWVVPELTEPEAEELMSLVAERALRLWSIPEPARDAVRRPLFAIIAGKLHGANRPVPQSQAQFLNALTTSALATSSANLSELLADLAVQTLTADGRAPLSSVGDEFKRSQLIATRLVTEEGGALRFSLPILEQFFAAQAIRRQRRLVDIAFTDIATFERWRYALAMALAMMTWDESRHAFSAALRLLPGTAWKLISAASAERGNAEAPLALSDEEECESRLHDSLTGLVQVLGESSRLLPLVGATGEVLPVGVVHADGWLSVGLWSGPASEPPRDQLPDLFGQHRSSWIFQKSRRAGFSTEVWPIGEAIDLLDRAIQALIRHPGFPTTGNSAVWPERRYEIARILSDETSLLKSPVQIDVIRHTLVALSDAATDDDGRALIDYRFSGRNSVPRHLVAWASELRRLAQEIEAGTSGEIDDPWTSPDNLTGRSGWTWDLWTKEAWAQLVEEVYSAALQAYDELTSRWFGPLRPFFGLGCMWPVELRMALTFMDKSSGMPGAPALTGRFAPLPPGQPARVTMTDEDITWVHGFEPPKHERMTMDEHHPGMQYWSRWVSGFQTVDVAGMEDTPALDVAYQWIIEDLVRIGVIRNRLFRRQR